MNLVWKPIFEPSTKQSVALAGNTTPQTLTTDTKTDQIDTDNTATVEDAKPEQSNIDNTVAN